MGLLPTEKPGRWTQTRSKALSGPPQTHNGPNILVAGLVMFDGKRNYLGWTRAQILSLDISMSYFGVPVAGGPRTWWL